MLSYIFTEEQSKKCASPHVVAAMREWRRYEPNNVKLMFSNAIKHNGDTPIPFILGFGLEEPEFFENFHRLFCSKEEKENTLKIVSRFRTATDHKTLLMAAMYFKDPANTMSAFGELSSLDRFVGLAKAKDSRLRNLAMHAVLANHPHSFQCISDLCGMPFLKKQLHKADDEGETPWMALLNNNKVDCVRWLLSNLNLSKSELNDVYRLCVNDNDCRRLVSEALLGDRQVYGFSLIDIIKEDMFSTFLDMHNIFPENLEDMFDFRSGDTWLDFLPLFKQDFLRVFVELERTTRNRSVPVNYHTVMMGASLNDMGSFRLLIQNPNFRVTLTQNNNEFLKEAIHQRNLELTRALLEMPLVQDSVRLPFLISLDQRELQWLLDNLPVSSVSSQAKNDITLFVQNKRRISATETQRRQTQAAFAAHGENAMNGEEEDKATADYNILTRIFGPLLYQRGLENVEADLRGMLLDKILENLPANHQQRLFIESNKEALKRGDNEALMDRAREYFSSTVNEDHIAWRAYDRFAPYYMFGNLFAGPQADANIRDRAALYYLALSAPVLPKGQAASASDERSIHGDFTDYVTRRQIFVGQLAEIRRAPGHTQVPGADNPSCAPGTRTRLAKAKGVHPSVAMVNATEVYHEIMQTLLTQFAQTYTREYEPDQKAILALALEFFSERTFSEIVAGKRTYNEPCTGEEISVDILFDRLGKFREKFLQSFGGLDAICDRINQELLMRRNPRVSPLTPSDKIHIIDQLYDLSHHGIAGNLAALIRPKNESVASSRVSDEDEEAIPSIDPRDPFGVTDQEKNLMALEKRNMPAPMKNMLLNKARQAMKKSERKNAIFRSIVMAMEPTLSATVSAQMMFLLTKEMVDAGYEDEVMTMNPTIIQKAYEEYRRRNGEKIPALEDKRYLAELSRTIARAMDNLGKDSHGASSASSSSRGGKEKEKEKEEEAGSSSPPPRRRP